MGRIIQFGETVEGYEIPVLNEREIRAAAGILFLVMYTSVMLVFLKDSFFMIKYSVTLFLSDFLIRVFVNPRFSPTLIIGRWIVRNQTPEYVGARQKHFAWIIGVVLSTTFFSLLVAANGASPITALICLVCLIFLFFEAVFGICLGCKMYPLFFKDKVQYCPGEVCDPGVKHDIQKTTAAQWAVVLVFVFFMVSVGMLFGDYFGQKPYDMFGIEAMMQSN